MTASEVKRRVRERDGFCCVSCGMSNAEHKRVAGKQLEVHRKEPGTPYTVDGCETLCGACHSTRPRSRRGGSDHLAFRVPRTLFLEALGLESTEGLNIRRFIMRVLRAVPRETVQSLAREERQPRSRVNRPAKTVRIAGDIMRMIRYICTHTPTPDGRKLRVSELIDSLIRDRVRADYEATMQRMTEEWEARRDARV